MRISIRNFNYFFKIFLVKKLRHNYKDINQNVYQYCKYKHSTIPGLYLKHLAQNDPLKFSINCCSF